MLLQWVVTNKIGVGVKDNFNIHKELTEEVLKIYPHCDGISTCGNHFCILTCNRDLVWFPIYRSAIIVEDTVKRLIKLGIEVRD